ncbi:hypothetical protein ACLOAV_008368 [Pseudogymnoascus australis]
MSPLNREEVSAIEALLALGYQTGDSFNNQRVNTCLISNIESKENGHHTHVTLATNLKTTTTITKDASPAEYLFYPQYCTGAEVYVSMEDCGTSSIDAEFWRKYLAEFPGESLSRISTDGSNIGGEGEPNGSTFKLGYGEAFADGYGEEWATIYNREINDLFPENWAVSNDHVASLELGMNWEEWSELIDEQQKEKVTEDVQEKLYEDKDQAPAIQSRSHQGIRVQKEKRLFAAKISEAQSGEDIITFLKGWS